MKYEEKAGEKWEIYICRIIIFTMYIPAAKSCAITSSGILWEYILDIRVNYYFLLCSGFFLMIDNENIF